MIALDTSQTLIDELETHKKVLPVQVVRDDLRNFARLVTPEGVGAIICMGDTLTHLSNPADI